jgi:hypothetical protein
MILPIYGAKLLLVVSEDQHPTDWGIEALEKEFNVHGASPGGLRR